MTSTGHGHDDDDDDDAITLFTVRDKAWTYRAEGNGNLVISLDNMDKILRLPKTATKTMTSSGDTDHGDDEDDVSDLRHLVSFVDLTVAPRLGRRLVHTGEIVRISVDELSWLNDQLEPLRPECRRHKSLAMKDGLALLQPDHCSAFRRRRRRPSAEKGSTLVPPFVSLEIKPKTGFLPMPAHNDDNSNSPTPRICKFHLMQLWKLHEGKIAKISDYCPLDLFSGCPRRMTKSLRQLLLNPQNNLRIFQDGFLVYGEGFEGALDDILGRIFHDETDPNSALDRLCRLVVEALLHDHCVDDMDIVDEPQPASSTSSYLHHCQRHMGTSFEDFKCGCREVDGRRTECGRPTGSILNRLLAVQMLHDSDVSSLTSACHGLRSWLTGLPSEATRILLYGRQGNADWKSIFETIPALDENDVRQIHRYLLSCTARDCSIMLKLCQLENVSDVALESSLPPDQFIITEVQNDGVRTSFLCSLAFIDLDWKPLSRVIEHSEQEHALRDIWTSTFKEQQRKAS